MSFNLLFPTLLVMFMFTETYIYILKCSITYYFHAILFIYLVYIISNCKKCYILNEIYTYSLFYLSCDFCCIKVKIV